MNRSNHQQQHHHNQPQQQQQQQQQRHQNQFGGQQQQQQPSSGQQYLRGSSPPGSYSNNNNNNNYNNNNNNMHYQQYPQQQQQPRQQYNGNSYGGSDQGGQNQHGGSQQQQHQQHQQHQLQQHHPQQQQPNNQQEQQRQQHPQQNQPNQPQKGRGGQAVQERSTASVSDAGSSSPRSEVEGSNLRFKITLEAQTAAMQRQEETPVTYLNKGQFYTVALEDSEEYDGDITSVIKVTFHDASHRRLAAPYWSFWLSQQANPKTARALDIEKASSSGMMEVQSKTFDRISFKWNGKSGAKLMVRFNCLSTDFSRIKGVKGIPLRVHMDTLLDGISGNHPSSSSSKSGDNNNNNNNSSSSEGQSIERSFAKIKLFRDKGAERKNKDDHKHLEKMWDKMRGKNADTNPLVNMLAPVQSVSLFSECLDHPEGSGEDETLDLSETLALDSEADGANGEDSNSVGDRGSSSSARGDSENRVASPAGGGGGESVSSSASLQHQPPPSKKRRRATAEGGEGGHGGGSGYSQHQHQQQGEHSQHGSQVGFLLSSSSGSSSSALVPGNGGGNGEGHSSSSTELFLDRDPNYVPTTVARKRRPVLCLYIKIGGETVYRAVYLEKFTLADLIQKLSEKLEIQSSTISCVYRKTNKKELMVRMDDAMVAQMTDELDMVVDYEFNQMDGSVNLTLKY